MKLEPIVLKMFQVLDNPIPVDTPLGKGEAIFIKDNYWDCYWTVVLDNRAIVDFRQSQIRVSKSYTHSRGISHKQMKVIIK